MIPTKGGIWTANKYMIATSIQIKAMIHYFFEKSVVKIARLKQCVLYNGKNGQVDHYIEKMESN